MSIELRHLRYFLAVADTLHFGQAAERLGMSQPPLSQQIRQLEDLIGARLFVRSHRRVQLTPAGELLQERARAIVQQVETAVDEVQRAQRGEQGELRIGLTRATPLSPQIPRSILQYRQRYPQVRLQLSEMNTLQQIDALLEEIVDRFGKLPAQAQTLIDVHRLRVLSQPYGVQKVDAAPGVITITFKPQPPVDPMAIIALIQKNKHIKLAGNEKLRIERALPDPAARAQLVRDLLRSLGQPLAATA